MPGPAPVSLRLPRSQRLPQGRDFGRIKSSGARQVSGCLIANWQVIPAGSAPRIGVITSRKIGDAVRRSRARRLLREAFRLHQHDLTQPIDLVLVARNSIAGKSRLDVEKDFLRVLRQARLLKEAA